MAVDLRPICQVCTDPSSGELCPRCWEERKLDQLKRVREHYRQRTVGWLIGILGRYPADTLVVTPGFDEGDWEPIDVFPTELDGEPVILIDYGGSPPE